MDRLEQKILSAIEENRDQILRFASEVYCAPEPGFYEEKTAQKAADFLRRIGLDVFEHVARTGVRADWKEQNGPNITLLGEMDAIGCSAHPMADCVTGVAHACGHHAQLAAMMGAAIGLLSDPEVRAALCGSVSFFAVPAEEYIDAEKRLALKKEGIGFPASGKSELIRIGAFDRSDILLTTHVHMVDVKEDLYLGNPSCNGYQAEVVTISGKASHAAIAPDQGVNALHIASSAIAMMGMMRETFLEKDHIRLHNVIRRAGSVINSIPDEAVLETKVRASSLSRIEEVSTMIDRAYEGAAYAFGGKIHRQLLQGYMPIRYREADPVLVSAAQKLGKSFRLVTPHDFNNACTDVGDLTHLFPVLNFTFSGFQGALHSPEFEITDPEKAYILPAKMLALTVYGLLKDGARQANQILSDFQPIFSRESYCDRIAKKYYPERVHVRA